MTLSYVTLNEDKMSTGPIIDYNNYSLSGTHDHIYDYPSLQDYYFNLTPFVMVSIAVAVLLQIINVFIWLTTLNNLGKVSVTMDARQYKLSIILCSLYPFISCAAVTTILLPKAWLICNTIMHMSFTIGAIAFLNLCFNYIERNNNSDHLKEKDIIAIVLRTPPFCCCCQCLPTLTPTTTKLCLLRYMVWQMMIIQGAIQITLNIIYYTVKDMYNNTSLYFVPFTLVSIFVGIWALNITIRLTNTSCGDVFHLRKKMFCLQLILILCKLQYMLLDSQLNALILGQDYPMNHIVYKQTILNLLIMIEMVLVSLFVQNAYKPATQILNG